MRQVAYGRRPTAANTLASTGLRATKGRNAVRSDGDYISCGKFRAGGFVELHTFEASAERGIGRAVTVYIGVESRAGGGHPGGDAA